MSKIYVMQDKQKVYVTIEDMSQNAQNQTVCRVRAIDGFSFYSTEHGTGGEYSGHGVAPMCNEKTVRAIFVNIELDADPRTPAQVEADELLPTGVIPDSKCPNCGRILILKNKTRYMELKEKRQFVGCQGYPQCNYIAKKISPSVVIAMREEGLRREAQEVNF